MQLLTPKGYRDISECAVGDEIVGFDLETGAPVTNTIEKIERVDAAVFESWQNPRFLINGREECFALHSRKEAEPVVPFADSKFRTIKEFTVGSKMLSDSGQIIEIASIEKLDETPPFAFYRINDAWEAFGEESVWIDAFRVNHVKNLKVGDTVFNEAGKSVEITSIKLIERDAWHQLTISGNHTFIADGLVLHNASRFWVGGVGTWDASDTTHWSATTGGAGGSSVPGSSDTVTLDGSSGGGTVTVNTNFVIQSLTCGAFTGTLDFAANDNSPTYNSATGFAGSGTGTRTISLGDGTHTLSNATGAWNIATTTNLTFSANGSTIYFSTTAPTGMRTFASGGLTYNILSLAAITTGHIFRIQGNGTFASLLMAGAVNVWLSPSQTITVTNAFAWAGSSSALIQISNDSGAATIVATGGGTIDWAVLSCITFTTGVVTATNSYNLRSTAGVTITPPASGGGLKLAGRGGLAG